MPYNDDEPSVLIEEMSYNDDEPSVLIEGEEPRSPLQDVQPQTPSGLSELNPKQVASDIYTPLLKYGAGGIGGVAGMAASAPALAAGPVIGPAAMIAATGATAGIGYAGGASLAEALDQLIGLKPKGGAFFSVPSSEQVRSESKKYLETVKEGVEAEFVGQAATRLAGMALQPLIGVAAKGIARSPEYIAKLSAYAKELEINLTPAELAATKGLSIIENILDNLPWTSGIVQKYRLGELQKLNAIREKLIAENGSGKNIEELGLRIKNMADQFMQKTTSANKEAMIAMKNRLMQKIGSRTSYEDLDISAKEVALRYQQELSNQISSAYDSVAKQMPTQVSIPQNTVKAAESIIAQQELAAPALRDNRLLKTAKSFTQTSSDVPPDIIKMYNDPNINPVSKASIEEQFPGILNTGMERSYDQLSANLKALNQLKFSEVTEQVGPAQISRLGRDYSILGDAMRADMDALALSSGNKELIEAQNLANKLYVKKLALFQDPAFKAINNKYPGAVSKTILQSGNTELINRYRALTGETLFNKAKDRLTNDIIGLGESETVIADDIRKRILDLGESAKSIYSDAELTYFQKLANAIEKKEGSTSDLMNNPLIDKLAKSKETMSPGLASAFVKPNLSYNANYIEQKFGREGKKVIADAFLPELLSANQSGDFLPSTFAKTFDEYGEKTIEAWYGKEFTLELKKLAMVGKSMGRAETLAGNPSGTGRFIISYDEARNLGRKIANVIKGGMMVGLGYGARGPNPVLAFGSEGAFILTSRQLAKLYVSDAGKKLFIEGLITPQTANNAAQITGRILTIIGNEQLRKNESNR